MQHGLQHLPVVLVVPMILALIFQLVGIDLPVELVLD
jgi:hypothetical protein